MKKILLGVLLAFVLVSPVLAQTGQGGMEIDVLEAGVGARPLGMGGAFVAVSDNSDAPYWNPAGLSQIKFHEISTMQTKLSTDANHYYVSYAQPFLWGTIGLSWIQISLGDIYQTTTTNEYNEVVPVSVFSYFSNAYLLAYGQELNDQLSFGITAKYLTADMPGLVSVEGASAYGYSVTPGILWKATPQLTLGAKIDELVNSQKWGTGDEETVPPVYRLGVSYLTAIMGYPLLLAGDYSQIGKEGYAGEGALGAELRAGGISVRAGLLDSALTAGVGFQDQHIAIDYAYVNQLELSKDNVNRISLSGRW